MSTPEGFSTLTSVIISKNAKATIDSYEKALGADVTCMMRCPDSDDVAHACLKVGESTLFISDEWPAMNVTATGKQEFYLYVANADEALTKAKKAGWTVTESPEDMFWGDRVGAIQDLNGNTWKMAHKVRDVSPEEMEEAMKKMGSPA